MGLVWQDACWPIGGPRMEASLREVEVKFRVRDAGALLAALAARGIELGPQVRQDDQAYAPASWDYGDSRRGVPFARLRTVGGHHLFTLKRPVENVFSCEEYETPVADRGQMHLAIVAMGFRPTVRIVKVRRSGMVGESGVVVCLDEVEGLGFFLEVERLVADDVPGDVVQAELAGFVASLDVQAEQARETYDTLVRAAAR
jgi:adenylate cyclase class 2